MTLLYKFSLAVLASLSLLAIAGGLPESPGQLKDQSGQQPSLPNGTAALRQLLEPLNSFKARFEQTVYAPDGYLIQQGSGKLQVMRPGKVHWVSDEPFEQWVVADNETLWIYDPDLEQVTVRRFQENIANTPAMLFVGSLATLDQSYAVTVQHQADSRHFILRPTDQNSLYSKLSLSFDGETPLTMTLWSTSGQQTTIRFHEQAYNPKIDRQLFNFEPPPGVDILSDE